MSAVLLQLMFCVQARQQNVTVADTVFYDLSSVCMFALCGLRGCKYRSSLFPGRMS